MRGHSNVMDLIEHFEDTNHFYLVFPLARHGDLLEALTQRAAGFPEGMVQCFVKQAASGLAFLHSRHLSMQDVSLENMLLDVDSRGNYQVKICDPGQAVLFEVRQDGEEMPSEFQGYVGKSFRPPELYNRSYFLATKVDSWCLGWSTFYLLSGDILFTSADPDAHDAGSEEPAGLGCWIPVL